MAPEYCFIQDKITDQCNDDHKIDRECKRPYSAQTDVRKQFRLQTTQYLVVGQHHGYSQKNALCRKSYQKCGHMERHHKKTMQRSGSDSRQKCKDNAEDHSCCTVIVIPDRNNRYDRGKPHQGTHGKIDPAEQHNKNRTGYQNTDYGDRPEHVGNIIYRRKAFWTDHGKYYDKQKQYKNSAVFFHRNFLFHPAASSPSSIPEAASRISACVTTPSASSLTIFPFLITRIL